MSESHSVLGVVTLNWKRAADTIACIESIKSQAPTDTQYVIVDNGSGSEDCALLAKGLPFATLIALRKNLGFAAGFNVGIKKAVSSGCDFVLILNNDTIASAGMVQALLKEIAVPGVGVVSPLIYYYSNPTSIWSAGGNLLPFLATTVDAHSRSDVPREPTIRTFLSGCCLLIRREVLLLLGGFDERFFMYYEDLDFFTRLAKTKWIAKIVPDAKLLHKVSMSTGGEVSERERYLMAFSSVVYYKKHSNRANQASIIAFRFGSFLLNSIRMLMRGNFKGIRAYYRGTVDALKVSAAGSEYPKTD